MANTTEMSSMESSSEIVTGSEEVSGTISASLNIQLAYIIIGTIGILGNFIVAFVLLRVPALRMKLTNIFIINQSILDSSVSILLIASFNVESEVPWDDVRGDILCKLWQTKLFLWGFLVSSTYNLVALTIERYLEVLHPIWHKLYFNKNKAIVCLVAIWMFGLIWNASYMIPTSIVIGGKCGIYTNWPSPTVRKMFGVLTVTLQYIVPLIVLIFCYSAIALALHRKLRGDKNTSQGKEAKLTRGRRNTIKTLALVAACFVFCWSWNQIYYLMMNLGYKEDYESNFYHFTVIAVFLNSCINPIIYCLKYEPFKKAAMAMICKHIPGGHGRTNKVQDIESSRTRTDTTAPQ